MSSWYSEKIFLNLQKERARIALAPFLRLKPAGFS